MNRSTKNYVPGLRSGLTLIEVVAGLALMGTLLVTVILGASSHLRQLRTAQRKKAAIEMFDRLLAAWSYHELSNQSLPECCELVGAVLADSGGSSNSNELCVRVRVRPLALTSGLNVEVVRLEGVTHRKDAPPLTWIEVLRPSPPVPTRTQ